MPDTATETPRHNYAGTHDWKNRPKSEPLRCVKCGAYYASKEGAKPCPK